MWLLIQGINACRAALETQEDLEGFYVKKNGLSSSAAKAIVDILTFRTPTRLKAFHFSDNMSGKWHRACVLAFLGDHGCLQSAGCLAYFI